MGIADRLAAAGGGTQSQPEVPVQEVPDPAPAASAPAKAPEPPQEFDPSWWDGLGYEFAGDGVWKPEPKAALMLNGQKAAYRRETAAFSAAEKLAWIEARWARWYPGLDRAKSRTEFHATWICIRWSCEEAHRLATEAA
jgi:hypothetical protein